MRLFVAIPLPAEVTDALAAARSAFLNLDPGWRGEKWVATENLHLTLRFLGNVDPSDVSQLSDALHRATSSQSPFQLRLSGVRAVPSLRRATMLWAAFDDPAGGASALAAAITEATVEWADDDRPPKPFRAHATLVRARGRRAVSPESLGAAEEALRAQRRGAPVSMSVSRVILMSSTLTAHGPIYEELYVTELVGV